MRLDKNDPENPNSLTYQTKIHSPTNELEYTGEAMSSTGPGMNDVEVADYHLKRMAQIRDEETQARNARTAREDYSKKQQADLIESNAFKSQNFDKKLGSEMDNSEALANTYEATALKLMKYAPDRGMKMMKDSQELRSKANSVVDRNLKILQTKEEYKNSIANSMKDEASFKEGVVALSKAGIVVPPKYSKWNDDTKNFFEELGNKSELHTKEVELKLKEQQAGRQRIELELKSQALANKKALDDKRYTLMKEGLDLRKQGKEKSLTESDKFDYGTELSAANPEIADLEPAHKTAAVRDYFREIVNAAAHGYDNPVQAAAVARDVINSRVKDGKYISPKAGEKPESGNKEKPTAADIDYAKANGKEKEFEAHFGVKP